MQKLHHSRGLIQLQLSFNDLIRNQFSEMLLSGTEKNIAYTFQYVGLQRCSKLRLFL